MNFWAKTKLFSPIVCRLLARSSPWGAALTNAEIAQKTGLPVYRVVAISEQLDWSGVDLPTMHRFIEACGVDFEEPATYRRMVEYLRGKKVKGGLKIPPPFSYLRRHPDFEQFFQPLMLRWWTHHANARKVQHNR